ncbi:prolyl oligopeptidase-like protein [Coniella lustricola]|uniref:Carboxylic ester hydrolase n=1 Tax=Coniella lustricola TaxID=2025994 RepID=A0A2T2ZYQ3_9PEZI|nr:prolyl oligopeptidase-like protein [Coniella lustricola]
MFNHKSASLVALAGAADLASAALYDSIIQTGSGPVQGFAAFNSTPYGVNIQNWQDVAVWKGIPYGASTAGNNRWRPPQTPEPWNTTLIADSYGPVCPGESTSYTSDEDCLRINVWSAATSADDALPVMVWNHPAGGSNQDPLFDGAGMAAAGVVFINSNRRDGVLGWLAHPELSEERLATIGVNSSGNYGMLDEFAVLDWAIQNVAAFGGDPKRINIAGQSAGSAAAYHAVNSPLTKGKIVGAIAESGVRDPRDPLAHSLAENYVSLASNLAQGVEYMAANNVSSIAELRAIPIADLLDADGTSGSFGSTSYSWSATLDNYTIAHKYIDQLALGPANDVPFMTGNTKDESGATYGLEMTEAEYLSDFNTTFGNLSAEAEALWAPSDWTNETVIGGAYNALWRDTSLVSSWGYSQGWASSAESPIYTYYWDHAPPGQDRGAYHESEINYVLNNLYGTDLPWETVDYEIAQKMNAYWANFAKTGNPNRGGSYSGNETLVQYDATSSDRIVMHVGNGWGMVPLTQFDNQTDFILEYFSLQTPV